MLRTLFVLGILVPGIALGLRSRYAALVLYLWFALFRPQDWVWIDMTSWRVSLMLGALLVVPALATGKFPNVTNPISVGMIMFLSSAVATQTVAVRPDVGWVWIDFLFRLFLTSMMVITLATDAKRVLGVMAVIAGSLGFHAAKAGLAFLLGGGMRFADGLAGAFVDNNGYALGTVMIIPLLIATAQNVDAVYTGRWLPWIRRAWYVAVPLCVFAVIGTYSRGGFLALASAIIIFILLQQRRFTALGGLGLAVMIVVLFVPIPDSYLARLKTIQTYEEVKDDSAMSRPHFWRVGMRMVEEHPLGIGLKQYEAAYDRYDWTRGRYGRGRAVHSSHIQVLAEIGYPGALAWLGLFGYAVFACFRVRVRALLVSMGSFVVGGAFLSLALNDLTWLTFAIVAAVDRLSARLIERPQPAVAVVRPVHVPLAFRAIDTVGAQRGAPC
jgi:putative inorganic carbon (HCO3(-)) transporter